MKCTQHQFLINKQCYYVSGFYVCTKLVSHISSNVSPVHLHGNKYVSDFDYFFGFNHQNDCCKVLNQHHLT